MRITTLFTLALGFASPLAAQVTAQHKVVFLNGDTLVTIEKGDRDSCTVKIGDRTLGERQAGEICAAKEKTITFTTSGDHQRALMELDGVRTRLRALTDSSLSTTQLNALRQQEALLAQALSARSQAFNTEAMQELLARSRELSEPRFFGNLMTAAQQGSIIGVSIDPRPRDTDRWGAYVAGVTPNGPADRAGIRAGDIIARVDGQSITSGRTERAATDEESLVWLRLSEVVRKLEPGKSVELEYRRDGRNQTTRVTPIEDNRWFAMTIPQGTNVLGRTAPPDAPRAGVLMPSLPRGGAVTVAPAPSSGSGSFYFSAGGTIANLELAPMNEKLGNYFGTTRGVLILSAPAERNLGLEAGDVVINVDGRTVDTPSELIRVLRTYDRDKQFTMQVMRQKQRQSITTTLP